MLSAQQTPDTRCHHCKTNRYKCGLGHTMHLCAMRHAKQHPNCPINPDDGCITMMA